MGAEKYDTTLTMTILSNYRRQYKNETTLGHRTISRMYSMVLPVLFVFAEAAKFDNRVYLPPPNWKDAGGQDEDLEVPLEPPYIDSYSDNRHLPPTGRGYHPLRYPQRKGLPGNWYGVEDEDQDYQDGLGKPKNRFLYGSYSYTGPDNIVVTVTYTADRKKQKGRRRFSQDDYDYDADEYDCLEGGAVPTPPSLPRELQKAFAFHKKQYQPDKKDNRKIVKTPQTSRQPWSEQPVQKPTTHQGYSYPKQSPAKN